HVSYVEAAQSRLALFGFSGMALLGSIHYIVPRLVQVGWACATSVQAHFWCSATGIGLVFLGLTFGGLVQALGINAPAKPFIQIVKSTVPFVGLATLGLLLL